MTSNRQTLSNEEIASRAYSYWDRDGRIPGRDLDYWLRAESDLIGEQRNGGRNGGASAPEKGRGAPAPKSRRATPEAQPN